MTDLEEARERNEKATVACVLGSVSFFCVALLGIATALNQDWLMEPENAAWLILPFMALVGGGVATFIGIAAWVDARASKSGNGLRQAQVGAILGGIAAGLMILTVVVLFVILIFYIIASANETN